MMVLLHIKKLCINNTDLADPATIFAANSILRLVKGAVTRPISLMPLLIAVEY